MSCLDFQNLCGRRIRSCRKYFSKSRSNITCLTNLKTSTAQRVKYPLTINTKYHVSVSHNVNGITVADMIIDRGKSKGLNPSLGVSLIAPPQESRNPANRHNKIKLVILIFLLFYFG